MAPHCPGSKAQHLPGLPQAPLLCPASSYWSFKSPATMSQVSTASLGQALAPSSPHRQPLHQALPARPGSLATRPRWARGGPGEVLRVTLHSAHGQALPALGQGGVKCPKPGPSGWRDAVSQFQLLATAPTAVPPPPPALPRTAGDLAGPGCNPAVWHLGHYLGGQPGQWGG